MKEDRAKQHLTQLLDAYTVGSVLHLLADHYGEQAELARIADDAAAFQRCKTVEHALFVMGMGVDAANPS